MAKAKREKAAVKKAVEQAKKVSRKLKKAKKAKAKDNKVEKRLVRAKRKILDRLRYHRIVSRIRARKLRGKDAERYRRRALRRAELFRLRHRNSPQLHYRVGRGKKAHYIARRKRTLRLLMRKVLSKDLSKLSYNRLRHPGRNPKRGRVGRSLNSALRFLALRRRAYVSRAKKARPGQMVARRAWAAAIRSWKHKKGGKVPFHKKDVGHAQFVSKYRKMMDEMKAAKAAINPAALAAAIGRLKRISKPKSKAKGITPGALRAVIAGLKHVPMPKLKSISRRPRRSSRIPVIKAVIKSLAAASGRKKSRPKSRKSQNLPPTRIPRYNTRAAAARNK